jgi:thymidylate synthase
MLIARSTNLELGEFVHTLGDAHIYTNHMKQVEEQLTRLPRPLPKMTLNPEKKSIFDFEYSDFQISDYNPHPHIKGDISV